MDIGSLIAGFSLGVGVATLILMTRDHLIDKNKREALILLDSAHLKELLNKDRGEK